jgi:hypothetical protein
MLILILTFQNKLKIYKKYFKQKKLIFKNTIKTVPNTHAILVKFFKWSPTKVARNLVTYSIFHHPINASRIASQVHGD